MTVALDGHAVVNPTEARTEAGASSRSIRTVTSLRGAHGGRVGLRAA
jgi:hypothetical protein